MRIAYSPVSECTISSSTTDNLSRGSYQINLNDETGNIDSFEMLDVTSAKSQEKPSEVHT